MIIKETKADEIRAAKDAWDAEFEKANNEYEDQEQNYRYALYTVMENIEQGIRDKLSDLNIENLTIEADPYGGRFGSEFHTDIKFKYGRPSDNKTSLRWDAKIYLNNSGEVMKETGSWSGLEATTPELIADLKNSVQVIERIMNMDWQEIILDAETKRPNYKDYITKTRPNRGNRPKFEDQILEATIDDIGGTNTLIKGNNNNYRRPGWYKVIKATPKRYTVSFTPDNYLGTERQEWTINNTFQMDKTKFMNSLVQPIETTDI